LETTEIYVPYRYRYTADNIHRDGGKREYYNAFEQQFGGAERRVGKSALSIGKLQQPPPYRYRYTADNIHRDGGKREYYNAFEQ
jgi:hypothetical protein